MGSGGGCSPGNFCILDLIPEILLVVMMKAILGRETEVRRKTNESAAKDEEIQHLQQELE